MARTARSVATVEFDPERAALAAERLAPYSNVELLVGDWRELLPPRGPFELVVLDGGGSSTRRRRAATSSSGSWSAAACWSWMT